MFGMIRGAPLEINNARRSLEAVASADNRQLIIEEKKKEEKKEKRRKETRSKGGQSPRLISEEAKHSQRLVKIGSRA